MMIKCHPYGDHEVVHPRDTSPYTARGNMNSASKMVESGQTITMHQKMESIEKLDLPSVSSHPHGDWRVRLDQTIE